jgi:hypothetical protein
MAAMSIYWFNQLSSHLSICFIKTHAVKLSARILSKAGRDSYSLPGDEDKADLTWVGEKSKGNGGRQWEGGGLLAIAMAAVVGQCQSSKGRGDQTSVSSPWDKCRAESWKGVKEARKMNGVGQ